MAPIHPNVPRTARLRWLIAGAVAFAALVGVWAGVSTASDQADAEQPVECLGLDCETDRVECLALDCVIETTVPPAPAASSSPGPDPAVVAAGTDAVRGAMLQGVSSVVLSTGAALNPFGG